ncbi:MAG TPA: hypothetical protein VGO39_13945, partial [Gaiellaceae bacterium]|nr:hypothetical protein [Gaiellaceae bacterium]
AADLRRGRLRARARGVRRAAAREPPRPVHRAAAPRTGVAVGSGRSLEEFDAIHRSSRARSRSRNGRRHY